MKKLKNFTLISIILIVLLSPHNAFANNFTDVKEGNTHYMAITQLKDLGIIEGYEDNTFKSQNKVNRAEAIKMLILASGQYQEEELKEFKVKKDPFKDTPKTQWYAPYIAFAKEKNIISGYPDETFKPENTINLVEALKIYLESYPDLIYPTTDGLNFIDCDPSDWYGKYIAYGNSRDMLEITPKNEIMPTREMTRGYLAELIYRKKQFSEGYRFGKATFYGSAVHGNNTASGERFNMYDYTAAHKTLPFGTVVEATNLANGKSVQVRITDRGPYGPGRVLDLTTTAFSQIAWTGTGVINIQYKVISMPE